MVFTFTAVASNSDWADSTLLLLQAGTLVAALYTSGVARADSTISVGLIVISASCAILLLVFGGTGFETLGGDSPGCPDRGDDLRGGARGRRPGRGERPGRDRCDLRLRPDRDFVRLSLRRAGDAGSGNFFAQGTDGTRSLRLYFSFVTLATLGYGDYTAAGELGRTLAVVEALFGQLYLVTVVAVLVSRMRGRQLG